ncbi:MAG: hypothetical protein CVV27_17255 [Candidatus Melainabacteria bacterium HGW-Melainabacteria-1]|nr:MAG: hypothetical protein CVV27_17255 [Candidatus Melainabacteria bacterium HGW-Melainabacteria-1]
MPIEIAEDTFWVSQRDPNSLLQTNTYLRRFRGNGKTINYLIDPGPLEFFAPISSKISNVIQDVRHIQMYSINHQDPDVGMNATFLARINPRSICLCSEDTWRLVRFYEIPSQTYKNVYSFNEKRVALATDPSHVLEFIPTPYCHFVGAFAVYDRHSGMLFTGDLFGGLNPPGDLGLFAGEQHWDGIKTFHEIYMPFNRPVRAAIDRIRRLTPYPKAIVPQHGAVLSGEIMERFLDRLYDMPMGFDLHVEDQPTEDLKAYTDVIRQLYQRFMASAGPEESELLFDFSNRNQELFQLVDMDIRGVQGVRRNPARALELLLNQVSGFYDRNLFNELRSMAIKETVLHHLPLPMDALYHRGDMSQQAEMESPLLME